MAVKKIQADLDIAGKTSIDDDLSVNGKVKTTGNFEKKDSTNLIIKVGGTDVVIPYVNNEDYENCANRTYDSSETYYVFNGDVGFEPADEYTEFTTEMQLEWLGEELTASNFDDYKDFLYIYVGGGQHNELTFPQKSGTVATTDDVKANPTLDGTEANLEGLEVNGVKFKVGGGGELYEHNIVAYIGNAYGQVIIYTTSATALTLDFLVNGASGHKYSHQMFTGCGFTHNNKKGIIGSYTNISKVGSSYIPAFYFWAFDGTNEEWVTSGYTVSMTDTVTRIL